MVPVYNYLIESYPMKSDTMYPVSKKNDLRKVYNDIVNLSKRLPFYIINLTQENQEYTLGIKETAIVLKAKIINMEDPQISGFSSKTVSISDESVISAQLQDDSLEGLPDALEFKVKSLANVQINRGRELLISSRGLTPGEYEFSAMIGDEYHNLKYIQEGRQENRDTIKKMADFLNHNLPGINAAVEMGSSKDYCRLVIASDHSGRYGDKKFVFVDNEIYKEGVIDFFGMNRMEKESGYAEFELNGVDKQTATNAFTLDNVLRISLNNSSEQPVTVKIVPDSDKILSAVNSVVTTYNELIQLAKDRTLSSTEHYKATKLINEMRNLEDVYKEELDACGLKITDDGIISIEEPLASQAAQDGGMESLFTRENGFITRLLDKAEAIAINPIEYLDKTIVTYPDSEKNTYRNPYITSMYSGLLFNSYC